MKKLLVLALTCLFLLGISTVSTATVTVSGEIDTGFQGWQQYVSVLDHASGRYQLYPGSTASNASDYLFGKLILNGKLGDDLTGTIVLKDADNTYSSSITNNMSSFAFDEASMTFTKDWGNLKLGYFGWNNNLKDILDVWTDDIKSQATFAYSAKLTDNLNLGLVYAFTGNSGGEIHDAWINDGTFPKWVGGPEIGYGAESSGYRTRESSTINIANTENYKNAFGGDLGISGEICGGDLLYYHYNDIASAWGVNAYIKLGDFKPFIEYRNYQSNGSEAYHYNLVNSIIGFTYDSPNFPLYARVEVELNDKGFFFESSKDFLESGSTIRYSYFCPNYTYISTPFGIRIGYKLPNGSKIEGQYYNTGYDVAYYINYVGINGTDYYNDYYASAPSKKYYLKLICPL